MHPMPGGPAVKSNEARFPTNDLYPSSICSCTLRKSDFNLLLAFTMEERGLRLRTPGGNVTVTAVIQTNSLPNAAHVDKNPDALIGPGKGKKRTADMQ
jgi:hypothetical protein